MKLLTKLERCKEFWWLLGILSFFFLLRLPSLFEPYWYGDEGIYQIVGLALREGRMLYAEAWDNKPPLLYLTYALFNSEQFYVKLASLLSGLFSISIFFYLSQALVRNFRITLIITILFASLIGLPIIEGNIANAENFMMPLILAAGYLLFTLKRKDRPFTHFSERTILIIAGILLGTAFLYKTVAIFDFAAFFIFLIITMLPKERKPFHLHHIMQQHRNQLLLFSLSFLTPFFISVLFFLFAGTLTFYLQAIFFSNVGYVNYNNVLLIPQGLLLIKSVLLILLILYLFLRHHTFSSQFLFVVLWAGFALFNSFFSQRPYTHYMLVLLPSFCLMLGLVLAKKEKNKTLLLSLTVIIFLLAINFFDRWSVQRTTTYYTNFLSFVTNQRSLREYQAFFDSQTPRDTNVAYYLKNNLPKNASVFIWGNSAQMYTLSDKRPPTRFVVAYHVLTNKETQQETQIDLERIKPTFIAILPNIESYPFPMYNYAHKITIEDVQIYERIY